MTIDELLEQLDEILDSGIKIPGKRTVVDIEKLRAIIDDIRLNIPAEIKQARGIVSDRADIITNAKREAENILKQAEQRARQMISREEIVVQAEQEANLIIANAQKKLNELKQRSIEYVDDALQRTEESIANALNEIKASRSSFMALTGTQPKQPSPIIEDI